jgi:hypothetical protein
MQPARAPLGGAVEQAVDAHWHDLGGRTVMGRVQQREWLFAALSYWQECAIMA